MGYRRTWGRTVCAVLALALALIPTGCAYLPNPMPAPDAWARDYVNMLMERDFGGMYAMIAPESRADIEEQQRKTVGDDAAAQALTPLQYFVRRHENIYNALSLTSISASLDQPARVDDRYEYTCTVLLDSEVFGLISQRFILNLRPYEDGWVAIWNDAYILEGLEAGDTVRLNTLQPRRGEILDQKSNAYARNLFGETVYTARSEVEDTASFAMEASKYLRMKAEDIVALLNRRDAKDTRPILLQTWLPGGLDAALKENLLAIPGMMYDDSSLQLVRVYPQADMTAHLVGYMGYPTAEDLTSLDPSRYNADTRIGVTGLEKAFESVLKGYAGMEVIILDESGSRKKTIASRPREDGLDITLTLDYDLQWRAATMLETLREDERGSAVVLDYVTGDVLALASYPTFDPNLFAYPLDDATRASLNDPLSGNPLYNRATQGAYPPGSTVKPFVAALGLKDGGWRLSTEFKGSIVKNQWIPSGLWPYPPITRNSSYPGALTMANAIVWSDNIYFADMALKIGWDPLKDFYLSLGIGKTGFPFQLPVVSSKIANTRDNAFSGNKHLLASTGFGQGEMIISPLQMATVFSQLANSGVAMAPRVVADTRRLSGNDYQVVDEFPSEPWIEGVLSTEIIDSLKPVLRRVMTEGTGRKARQDGVTVYAKTGTAQVGSGDDLRNIAWFIGFTDPSMGYTRLVCVTMEVDVDMGDMKYDIAQKLLMP